MGGGERDLDIYGFVLVFNYLYYPLGRVMEGVGVKGREVREAKGEENVLLTMIFTSLKKEGEKDACVGQLLVTQMFMWDKINKCSRIREAPK